MKKILVPVDFSNHSEYALEVAANLAKKHDAKIIALHMMGISDTLLTKNQSKQMFEGAHYVKIAEEYFKEFLKKDFLNGVKVTDAVYNYKHFKELKDVANDYDVDLIVMGSHGSSGLSEVFVGSNTEKVVRNANVPVLVIKHRVANFQVKNAVFACDFTSENIGAYHKATDLFSKMDANVSLLYVNLPGQQYRSSKEMEDRVRSFISEADNGNMEKLNDVVYYNDYEVEDGIFNYSNQFGVDVIALPTHGRRGISHFFSGSISEDLVNHSNVPVITFKL